MLNGKRGRAVIDKISFLQNGEKRVFVSPTPLGYFKIPGKTNTLPLTANQFVRHHDVVDNDPTITMKNGKKYRVFHASNPTIPLVYPSIILDNHDVAIDKRKDKKDLKEKLKKKTEEASPNGKAIIPPYTLGKKTTNVAGFNLPFLGANATADEADDDDFIYFDDDEETW